MNRPTAAEYRANSRIADFLVANGFPVAVPDTALEEEIALAWAYVSKITCRNLDALDENDPSAEGDIIIARRAVLLRVLQTSVQQGVDYTEGQLNDMIKSFSVPGYSETRADQPTDMKSAWRLNNLPVLHDLLRLLITEECWQKHLSDVSGQEVPYSQAVEVDWLSFPYSNP